MARVRARSIFFYFEHHANVSHRMSFQINLFRITFLLTFINPRITGTRTVNKSNR